MKSFRILNIEFKKISDITIFTEATCKVFVEFRCNFNHLKPTTENICNIAHPNKLFTSQYRRYDDVIIFIFMIMFHVFVISFSYQSIT